MQLSFWILLIYTLAIQQSLVRTCILNGKRKLAAKCTLRSSIVWVEAKRSLSVIFCAHSIPVCATAALYRPHSACPTLPFRAGVPPPCKVSPVQPWEGGKMEHELPSSPACSPAQQDTSAGLLPAEGGVSVGLRKAAVLQQPSPPQVSRRHVSAILHYNFYCQSSSGIGSNHFIFLSQISWKAGCYWVAQRSLSLSSPFSKRFYGTAGFGTQELLSVDTGHHPVRFRWSSLLPLLLRSH